MTEYEFQEVSNISPFMSGSEFSELLLDIKQHGLSKGANRYP